MSDSVSSAEPYEADETLEFIGQHLFDMPWELLTTAVPDYAEFIERSCALLRVDKAAMQEFLRYLHDYRIPAADLNVKVLAAAMPAQVSANRRPHAHLVVLVILWLILIGGPMAEGKLSSEIQMMLSTEIGTVALGLAITQAMNQKK
jgi:hypothetical protein